MGFVSSNGPLCMDPNITHVPQTLEERRDSAIEKAKLNQRPQLFYPVEKFIDPTIEGIRAYIAYPNSDVDSFSTVEEAVLKINQLLSEVGDFDLNRILREL